MTARLASGLHVRTRTRTRTLHVRVSRPTTKRLRAVIWGGHEATEDVLRQPQFLHAAGTPGKNNSGRLEAKMKCDDLLNRLLMRRHRYCKSSHDLAKLHRPVEEIAIDACHCIMLRSCSICQQLLCLCSSWFVQREELRALGSCILLCMCMCWGFAYYL